VVLLIFFASLVTVLLPGVAQGAGAARSRPVLPVASLDPTPDPASPWYQPPPDGVVDLVYTGALGGIGSGRFPLEVIHPLWALQDAGELALSGLEVVPGGARQPPFSLLAGDGRIRTVVTALQQGSPICEEPRLVEGVATGTEQLFPDGADDAGLMAGLRAQGLAPKPTMVRACRGAGGQALLLLGPADEEPSWELPRWEIVRGLRGTAQSEQGQTRFRGVVLPTAETSRLVHQARAFLDAHPGALFVDAGSFLDGASSVRNDRLSLHRPLGWQLLTSLHPAALVPGETELALGARAFHADQEGRGLPYLASNWEAPAELELPDHVLVQVDTAAGPVRVAFVGVLDPALAAWIPALGQEGVRITDPVTATQAVVDALYASDTPPDTVVALTSAQGEVLTALRVGLRGVDLLAGDPTFATLRVRSRDATLRPLGPEEKGAPLTLSLDGLATAHLRVSPGKGLVGVQAAPILVGPELPADPEVVAAITATRALTYPPLDLPLVPAAQADDPTAAWTPADWSRLVCEAVRDTTGADVVMLRSLPVPDGVPGPLSELLAVDYLAMLDRLELHRVPGDKLKAVLDRAYGTVPVACGASPGSDAPKARGRALEATRTYRLVTTDRTLTATALGQILASAGSTLPLDPAPVVPLLDERGDPLTIRSATLKSLRRQRRGQTEPDQAVRTFLAQAASQTPGMWLLRITGISLAGQRFQGADQAAFAEVPETLATSPSSFGLSTAADLALQYSDPGVAWDLHLRESYARQDVAGSDSSETADDWRASTSVGLPGTSCPAVLTWSPFSELLFDSEFTPTVDEAGATNPRQEDLSLTLGLSAAAKGPLTTLRLGGFANRDLARLRTKATEWGGRAEAGTSVKLGLLGWSTTTEAFLYANTPDDDASDLRFKVQEDTTLAVPLARWLNIALVGQGLLLQGRAPSNDVLGGSWSVGAALTSAGAFDL